MRRRSTTLLTVTAFGYAFLYLLDLPTGESRSLSKSSGLNASPAWHPNGQRLAVVPASQAVGISMRYFMSPTLTQAELSRSARARVAAVGGVPQAAWVN